MDKKVRIYAEVYVKAGEPIEIRRRLGVGEVPEGVCLRETFLKHILYHLSTYLGGT